MNKIKKLDSTVFNKIAAGEVVERPASVVKELVENSIDAGSSNIEIEITKSGLFCIKVSDNGCGIDKEDLLVSFEKHATSKISTAEDLDKICTLGFRGEALASIASVSEVTLQSKIKENLTGYQVECNAGVFSEIISVGMPNGTIIEVKNLFSNVPARLKFLKKPKTEEEEITNIVSRFILANPQISIKYIIDGKVKFLHNASNLENAIYTVLGNEIAANLIPVSSALSDNFYVTGFIAKPAQAKNNKGYQTLNINGRYVINSTVSAAASRAFDDYLMHGKFPVFVLNLNIPISDIDINVHPRKMEVRFEDNSKVFGLIYHACHSALLNYKKDESAEIFSTNYSEFKNEVKIAGFDNYTNMTNNDLSFLSNLNKKDCDSPNSNVTESEKNKDEKDLLLQNDSINKDTNNKKDDELLKNTDLDFLSEFKNKSSDINEQNNQINLSLDSTISHTNIEHNAYFHKIIGRVFNTYTLIEKGDKLYFIDEHACHERLLYDELCESINNKNLVVQPLLVPYLLNVNYIENEILDSLIPSLIEIGFDIEPFGNLCFRVCAVPLILKDINIKCFFDNLMVSKNTFSNLKNSDLIKDKLKQQACKAAVKSGFNLNGSEIEALIKNITDKNMILLCPHGRPAIVAYSRIDIDKWFKRIL